VQGARITDYCDEQRLSTAERLALFTHVCHAIQHAHQKGIIHRDIKPSNILIARQDGAPVPKVIDFGIAKATQGRLTERTMFTAFEQFVGTPAYMSPEQAALGGLDVDTRSDIYSLGVLLYELLAGRTPFDPQSLRDAGFDEVRRIIRDVEPPRPSARLSTLTDADRAAVAEHREIAPAELSKVLRGDLDWIVMRCLEKERRRRYDSPGALAADIARHLENEPVLARPPSSADRFRKLVMRHRLAFASAATIATLLVAGLAVSTWQYFRERAALARAVEAEQTQIRLRRAAEAALARATAAEKNQAQLTAQAEMARQNEARQRAAAETARVAEARLRASAEDGQLRARTEATRSAQVAKLMTEMFKGVGPQVAQGRDTKLLRDILDATAQRLDTELASEPEVELELRETLGAVYAELGDYHKTVAARRRVLALRQQLWADDPVSIAVAWSDLGRALISTGPHSEAEACYRTALAIQEKADPGRVPWTLTGLALALERQGRHAEAEALHRDLLARNQEQWGENSPNTAGSTLNLAGQLSRQGRKTEAEALLRESLAIQRAHPNNDTSVASSLNNLAMTLADLGKVDEAEAALREALALREKSLGPNHRELASWMANLAGILRRKNQLDEAETLYRNALALHRKFLGDAHPALIAVLTNLGHLRQTHHHWDEARTFFTEALAIQRRLQMPGGIVTSLQQLGQLEEAAGRKADAERCYREALDVQRPLEKLPGNQLRFTLASLVRVLRAQDRSAEALAFEREIETLPGSATTAIVRPKSASTTTSTASSTAPAVTPTSGARKRGVDLVSIVSVTPATARATPTEFTVVVRYRLGTAPVGRITLGFNSRVATQFITAGEKIIDAGEGEIEFKTTITPARREDGTKFSVSASAWTEPRVGGASSLAYDRRVIDVQ
jgi:eukaryotic-like serine/threonine-protein kinase